MGDGRMVVMVRRARSRSLATIKRTTRRMHIVRLVTAVAGIACFALWFSFARPAVFGGSIITISVSGHSMDPTYAPGDLLVVRHEDSYAVGDIVVYTVPEGNPGAGGRIVHRLVGGDRESGWVVKGDNNATIDPWQPHNDEIIGRVWLQVPKVASVFAYLRRPEVLAITIGLLTFSMLVVPKNSMRRAWKWFST